MSFPDIRRYRSGLAELIEALAAARTTDAVADALWWRRGEACGAVVAGLALLDPEPRLAGRGPAGTVPMELDPLLVAEFACAGAPLFFGSAEALLETYPVLRSIGTPPPGQACAVLPLTGRGTPAGALVVAWDRPRGFSPGDRGLLGALAALCSVELARTAPGDVEHSTFQLEPAGRRAHEGADHH